MASVVKDMLDILQAHDITLLWHTVALVGLGLGFFYRLLRK